MSCPLSRLAAAASCLLLVTCTKEDAPPVSPPPPRPPGLVSVASPFSSTCGLGLAGTVYLNAEVEPHLAVNPVNPSNLIGVWQQDRWSNGSARGLVGAASFDGGATWTLQGLPFSRCGGGNPANGGDFERATDPWVTFAADGTAYFMSLSTSGGAFQVGSANAMLVSHSSDGGRSWSQPQPLIRDTAPYFNDKNTITADPLSARHAYAVWDRLAESGGGPVYFARTTDGGTTWEPARPIHDPGPTAQTIGSLIVGLPSGVLVNIFTLVEEGPNQTLSASLAALRSTDQGATWSVPLHIADLLAVGASDPDTGAAIRDGSITAQAAAGPDGSLVVVWQDGRFSGGARDAIAFTRSTDGGVTWSTPLRVNPSAQFTAFTPSVHIRADGTLGITYYDLRDNTSSPTTLPTGYFLATSTNGLDWSETRISESFDLALAPNAGGLFLGDYQGLKSIGTSFLPFFARTAGDLANRTDICALRVSGNVASTLSAPPPSRQAIRESEKRMLRYSGETAGTVKVDPAFRRKVTDNLIRSLVRVPAWAKPRKQLLSK